LAADARLFRPEAGRLGPTLAGEELATDKLLAVFGRAEARDFVDLLAVERRYGLPRLCELAAEKDGILACNVLGDARAFDGYAARSSRSTMAGTKGLLRLC